MSTQKQERLLKARPEIVVGTPGRLWELMSGGQIHLVEVGIYYCLNLFLEFIFTLPLCFCYYTVIFSRYGSIDIYFTESAFIRIKD